MAILTALQELPISREVVASALAVLALAYIVNTIVVWRRLSHVPGPWWAGLSNWGFFIDAFKGTQPVAMRAYHEKYGMLFIIKRFLDEGRPIIHGQRRANWYLQVHSSASGPTWS